MTTLMIPIVLGTETHFDFTQGNAVANGAGDAFYKECDDIYDWDNTLYIGIAPDVDFGCGEYFYYDRPMINFDLSSIPSANVKVKKVELTLTSGVNWDVKQLTTLYYTTDSAQTVHDAIGSASAYVTNQADGGYRDLGANAVSQLEDNWLDDEKFAIGLMEYGENSGGTVSARILRTTLYYAPDEADTWQIDEDYPIGRSSGLGVGDMTINGDIQITATGHLRINGNTDVVGDGHEVSIAQGGSLGIEVGDGASLSVA